MRHLFCTGSYAVWCDGSVYTWPVGTSALWYGQLFWFWHLTALLPCVSPPQCPAGRARAEVVPRVSQPQAVSSVLCWGTVQPLVTIWGDTTAAFCSSSRVLVLNNSWAFYASDHVLLITCAFVSQFDAFRKFSVVFLTLLHIFEYQQMSFKCIDQVKTALTWALQLQAGSAHLRGADKIPFSEISLTDLPLLG